MHVVKQILNGISSGLRIQVNGDYGQFKKNNHTPATTINLKRKKSSERCHVRNATLWEKLNTFVLINFKNTSGKSI